MTEKLKSCSPLPAPVTAVPTCPCVLHRIKTHKNLGDSGANEAVVELAQEENRKYITSNLTFTNPVPTNYICKFIDKDTKE